MNTILEILAAGFTIWSLILMMKQKPLGWPVGNLSLILIIGLYIKADLYAQVGLQVLYLIQGFYGWYNWKKRQNTLVPTDISVKKYILQLFLGLVIGYALGSVLDTYTDSPAPYSDGAIAIFGLLANYYLTKKYLSGWVVYALVNIGLIMLCFNSGMYVLTLLNVILLLLSIKAGSEWYHIMKQKEFYETI